jgi:hypothetical protein
LCRLATRFSDFRKRTSSPVSMRERRMRRETDWLVPPDSSSALPMKAI